LLDNKAGNRKVVRLYCLMINSVDILVPQWLHLGEPTGKDWVVMTFSVTVSQRFFR